MYGEGTASFEKLLSQDKTPWESHELETLKAATRKGWRVYKAIYFDLRPSHRPQACRAA